MVLFELFENYLNPFESFQFVRSAVEWVKSAMHGSHTHTIHTSCITFIIYTFIFLQRD